MTSKPTWSNAFGCSATSVFLFPVLWDRRNDPGRTAANFKKERLIMFTTFTPLLGDYIYIGGGVLTLVIIVLVVLLFFRRL